MNEIERKILEMIGEDPDNPDVFTDGDGLKPIRDSINDCIQELAMVTGGNKRQYMLPLRQGQSFYRFRLTAGYLGWVTDAWSVTQQRRLVQTDLHRLTHEDPRWMKQTGSPYAYLPVGHEVIGVYPKPAGSVDTLELTIVEVPLEVAGSEDRLRLRPSFRHAVVHYAVADFWASRGDAAEAEKHSQLYLDAVGLKHTFSQRADPRQLETQKEPWVTQ